MDSSNLSTDSATSTEMNSVKECPYKLAAARAPIPDEDLVFYALNGLPTEFSSLPTAIHARVEPLKFEELVTRLTLLNAKEMQVTRNLTKHPDSQSVFVASQKEVSSPITSPQLQSQAPMLNLQYQPPVKKFSSNYPSTAQSANFAPMFSPAMNIVPSVSPNAQSANFSPIFPLLHVFPSKASRLPQALYSQNFTTETGPNMPFSQMCSGSSPSLSSTPWFFDSGATTHVTKELSQLKLQQQAGANTENVLVGNGSS
ncbi:hypothetical protein U1Q18_032945 [Sarracenia purpurea var. burkii]